MGRSLNNVQQSLRYDPAIFAFVEWRDIFLNEKNKQIFLKELSQRIASNNQLTIYQQIQSHMIIL